MSFSEKEGPKPHAATWSKLMPFGHIGPALLRKYQNSKLRDEELVRKLVATQVTPSLEDGFSPVGLNLRTRMFFCGFEAETCFETRVKWSAEDVLAMF